jgi:hypothetical protein
MFVCCECCVLSGRGLCDKLITRPEESYRLWYVVVFDLETPRMRRPWPMLGRSATGKKMFLFNMAEKWGVYRVLVGKPEGKRPLGEDRRRCEDNIKMDL